MTPEEVNRIRMYTAVRHAGYEADEVTNADVSALAQWWPFEGNAMTINEPEVVEQALEQIIRAFERLPDGRAFSMFVDTLHTMTVPPVGLSATHVNRAAMLWTQGRWSPGANGDMVVGIGRELHPFDSHMEALGKLSVKYAQSRQMVPMRA